MTDERTFVIIGASLAGAKAAETLRDEGFTGRVVLVGAETDRPYERPPLSKGYLQGNDPRDSAYVHDAQWYGTNDVDLVLGVTATALDPTAHTVAFDDAEPLRYDKLLITTGSKVRHLDVPGADLRGIRYLRTITESDTLRSEIREDTQVVVVGAGWIGLETAAAAVARGAAGVTVVELDTLPLRRVLGDEVATLFADLHRANGVTFHFSSGVREFTGTGGRLTHVVLSDGTELPADLAIVGVGIQPVTDLASSGGLEVDNGIVTDASLRTSDADIYAAGDVASWASTLLGRRIRVEHWANALNGGPAAARAMLGQDVTYDPVPYFFSDQYDLGMEYAGWVAPGEYDQVVFRGDPSIVDGRAPEVIAFWIKDGRVVAGMNINVWDVTDDIQALVRSRSTVDLSRLADPSVPLGEVLG